MQKILSKLLAVGLIMFLLSVNAQAVQLYSKKLCADSDYNCVRIKPGQSWEALFPDPEQRDIVKRVNRMNISLYPGLRIAVPKHLDAINIFDVSPFPRYIDPPGEKIIFVSQTELAFGAYDPDGELVWWGPISSGKDFCPDIGESCKTPNGDFRIMRTQGIECISTIFPKNPNGEDGGAPMPYCMHFNGGIAFHGSTAVPGHRDSHGCVRMFTEDARWLNQDFVQVTFGRQKGTRVIVGNT